jgi:diacylglycerol kinase family enzyme
MHVYIYDHYVNQKKYDKQLAQIETRLTDLGLNGKIVRMDTMNNIQESVRDELKRGATTIVAVGNNNTINQVATAVLNTSNRYLPAQVPVSIIPVDVINNDIAGLLGIPDFEEACSILLARKIEKIDVGCANNNFFISSAVIGCLGSMIKINDNYSVEASDAGTINIFNIMPGTDHLPRTVKQSPQDGWLELFISINPAKKILSLKSKKNQESFFCINNITIYNETLPLLLDGSVGLNCPVQILILKNALNLIVGKNRKF